MVGEHAIDVGLQGLWKETRELAERIEKLEKTLAQIASRSSLRQATRNKQPATNSPKEE
jgi:50S ribosomal subunit-associated GTPase HflX